MIRYVIEMFKFIYKLLHPNYYLKNIQIRDINQYRRLITEGRENYFMESYASYDWNSLRKSIRFGYIPSIVVYNYFNTSTNKFSYDILNGNHRFFILSENKKDGEYLKVWVNKKVSLKHVKAVSTAENLEKKVKKLNNKLKEDYYKRISNSPNKNRIKNN